jgi:carboxymethylenebutenolidase
VKAFETAMKSAGKSVDMKLYDDAGHAFANPENKDGYRPLDAADAWKRTMEFFDRTLRRTLRGPSTDSNN